MMWAPWAVARCAACAEVSLEGRGAHSRRGCEVDRLGAVRPGAGAVCAEYATPVPARAGQSSHGGRATVGPADSAGVTGLGDPHAVPRPGYLHVMDSVLSDPTLG